MNIINPRATEERSLAEIRELEQRYDGPIPPDAVVENVGIPTVENLESTLRFVRAELVREQKKAITLRVELIDAVAEWDVAPAHDKQRTHNVAQSRRRQVSRQEEIISELIRDQVALEDELRERANKLLQAAE